MSKTHDAINQSLEAWIAKQHMFFVASAPLSATGLVNCSPKGLDSFRVLGPRSVAYLDLTGSGIETVAHVRENGRIVIMFCAFDGPPKIVRFHGTADVIVPEDAEWRTLRPLFPEFPGARAIVRVTVQRISDTCGYAVPRLEFVGDRDTLVQSGEAKGPDGLRKYRLEKNTQSLDGLPGLDAAR